MARPQTHRKSQSTSALSVIASSTPGPSRIAKKGGQSGLERVEEGTPRGRRESGGEASSSKRDHGAGAGDDLDASVATMDELEKAGVEQIRSWMNEVLSLRITRLRRLELLGLVEEVLLRCCLRAGATEVGMTDLLALNIHTNLLILLSRHAQTLSSRVHTHTSLPPNDEIAVTLIPELTAIFGLLQGLSLLGTETKKACAEEWAIEMSIDLLLLLRSIPPSPSGDTPTKPVVYHILELLFCILVDSPANSRTFEKLSGLEAVTRVLKGSSVVKEVRMKCIEFLYFYLLPEHQSHSLSSSSASSRSTSGSSTSSGSLYPPSPLDTRSSFVPNIAPRSPTGRMIDLDVNFVPQTPRKKVSPNLGYLTPRSRRVSGSSGRGTPRLETVPASPITGEMTPRSGNRRGSEDVGLGLGLPGTKGSVDKVVENENGGMKRDVTAIHLGALVTSPEPHSSSRSNRQNTTDATQSPRSPRSSGSGKMSRSSTQPNLSGADAGQRKSSLPARRMSRSPLVQSSIPESPRQRDGESSRNASGESSATVNTEHEPLAPRIRHSHAPSSLDIPSSSIPPVPRPAKIRHSRTSSHLSSFDSKLSPPISNPPEIRHSRTSSQLSVDIDQAQAELTPRIRHSRTASHLASLAETPMQRDTSLPTPSSTSAEILPASSSGISMELTPSKARRGFPSELTRGLPPLGPTPSKPAPLGHTRRVPSLTASRSSHQAGKGGNEPGVKSVQEKKELLGKWIGNVEALVDGVERAGWRGKGK